jgi:NAD(P)-dependent dehydrogenase (short-subunit alcohol dehydrogenase family)
MVNLDYSGRDVVITGGTGALGSAVVDLLLAHGATCHVPARSAAGGSRERLHQVAGVDLVDEKAVRAFFHDLPSLWASLHLAGGFAAGSIEETSLEAYRRMVETNATSAFLCCREAVRKLRAGGTGGRIVNVASQPALEPRRGAGMVAYAASKAAVVAITGALAEEVAAEGIWVNAVAPSILDTEANRRAMPDADFSRWPKAAEVAAVIAFLASPQNQATRGGVLPVYGRT